MECRKCQPVGTFICHIDDLDVSDSITVARASPGALAQSIGQRCPLMIYD